MSQSTKQVRVVTQAAPVAGQDFEPTAFFDADGEPVTIGGPVAIADVTGLQAIITDLTDRIEALEA